MTLITKLERRLKRLKYALSLTANHSEESSYYDGRIEELEHVIKQLKEEK